MQVRIQHRRCQGARRPCPPHPGTRVHAAAALGRVPGKGGALWVRQQQCLLFLFGALVFVCTAACHMCTPSWPLQAVPLLAAGGNLTGCDATHHRASPPTLSTSLTVSACCGQKPRSAERSGLRAPAAARERSLPPYRALNLALLQLLMQSISPPDPPHRQRL